MSDHILIVEDDEMVQKFVALHLENEGYRTSTALTGADAMAVLAEHAVDLILLDLNLPDGDGLSIAQKVRETSSVPIIILTARKSQDDRMMGLGLGADEYLTKPVDPDELFLRVRNLLNRAGHAPVAAPPPRSQTQPQTPTPKPASPSPEPTPAPKQGNLGMVVMVIVLAAVVGGGAVWFFSGGRKPPEPMPTAKMEPAPPSKPDPKPGPKTAPVELPSPKPSPANTAPAITVQTPQKTESPAPTVKPEPKPSSPVEAMTHVPPSEEEPTKAIAEVLGYGWVLNSKCEIIPDVKWWKYKSHESIAGYVQRKYKGDWVPYVDFWYRRLVKLQDIANRNSSAVTSSGVVLKGDALGAYLEKMQKRLAVIRCLANEAKAFTAGR